MASLEEFRSRWTGHVPGIQDMKARYGVLVPLVERPEGLCLLYEVRADTLGRQPGEVCFPGGRVEAGESPETCALRETWEELGIPQSAVEIIAPLDLLTHQGGFVMHPFLGVVDPAAAVCPSPAEVKEVFTVPVDWLLAHPPAVYTYDLAPQVGEDFPYQLIGFPQGYPWRTGCHEVPIWVYKGHVIWGLTARVLNGNLREGGDRARFGR